MKILFIQKQMYPYIGVMSLSGILEKNGYLTDVLIDNNKNNIINKIKIINPDIIGFSVLSTEHNWLKILSFKLKSYFKNIPIIAGGIHPTLYAKDVLKLKGIDYICSGEGELSFLKFVEKVKAGKLDDIRNIKGIGYKKDNKIYLNGISMIIKDLDDIPINREVYYKRYKNLKYLSHKQFMSSRGCIFNCNFCANKYLNNIYKNKEHIRRKSPLVFIKEIKNVIDNYNITSIFFNDDLFVENIQWLKEFSMIYKDQINIPYMCTARADLLNEENIKILADSKCHTVSFGIETSDEFIRNTILNKNITNKQIIKAAKLLNNANIEVQTSNMFCLPNETIKKAIATINFNRKIKAKYMFSTLFLPFPKTELANFCIKNRILKKNYGFSDIPNSFVKSSVLNLKNKEKIMNIQMVSHICLKYKFLQKLLIYISKNIKLKKLFYLLYIFSSFIRYKDERKLSFFQCIKYFWTLRKSY